MVLFADRLAQLAALAILVPWAGAARAQEGPVLCSYSCSAAGGCTRLVDCTSLVSEEPPCCSVQGGGVWDSGAGLTCGWVSAGDCGSCPAPAACTALSSETQQGSICASGAPLLGCVSDPVALEAPSPDMRVARAQSGSRRSLAAGALTPLQQAVARVGRRRSPECTGAVPPGMVIVTYTNGPHFDLLLFSRRTMLRFNLSCVLERAVTVCIDDACVARCAEEGVPECVRYAEVDVGQMAEAVDRSKAYNRIIFIKWVILKEAIEHAAGVLFLDDDVAVLKNPFDFLVGGSKAYDFRHQTETGSGCGADANGGQLFVVNTPKGIAFLDRMIALRERIESGEEGLDQEFVMGAASEAGARRCALPKTLFAGYCEDAHDELSRVSEIVTFHAHCCGTHNAKLLLLGRVSEAASNASLGITFKDVNSVPLPGKSVFFDPCYHNKLLPTKLTRAVVGAFGGGG